MERFVGGLIEHYAGDFPLWLAPTQAVIIPISDRHQEQAQKLADKLADKNIRVHIDKRSETMNYRIREAEVQKVPYVAVLGDKELENNVVAVRKRKRRATGAEKTNVPAKLETMSDDQFVALLLEEINTRALPPDEEEAP
jgi:threonyl-tRNA synthetase